MAHHDPPGPRLLAVSDLHVGYPDNRELVRNLRPTHDDDWLIVAGDVGEKVASIEWTLRTLRQHFSAVIWVPGNHELWTPSNDPVRLRGEQRYDHLVGLCRSLGVITPEDPYPVWDGPGGPAVIVPMFLLYDYSFLPPGVETREAALELAYSTGVVCQDEMLLHPDPYPTRQDWCWARVEATASRLDGLDPGSRTVLVNHFPLTRHPTTVLRYPQFAQWCGTDRTADWHLRFRAAAVVYGHLHIPRTMEIDGVRFDEVSLGYPREWRPRTHRAPWPRQILPDPS